MVAYFYSDYGILASMKEARIQKVFEVLTELISRLVLLPNVAKKVSTACKT